jgi:Rod binding domain-containing protein
METAASSMATAISRYTATASTGGNANAALIAKGKAAAADFEAVFLQTMVEEMFAGIGEEGPLGGGEAGGAWRGLLVQEYAKGISQAGGIGIADNVFREILSLQEGSHASAGQ